jgi:hypothetical protein
MAFWFDNDPIRLGLIGCAPNGAMYCFQHPYADLVDVTLQPRYSFLWHVKSVACLVCLCAPENQHLRDRISCESAKLVSASSDRVSASSADTSTEPAAVSAPFVVAEEVGAGPAVADSSNVMSFLSTLKVDVTNVTSSVGRVSAMIRGFRAHIASGLSRFEALSRLAEFWHVQSDLRSPAGLPVPPLLEDRSWSDSRIVCVTVFWAERQRKAFWSARYRSVSVLRERSTPWLDHWCCHEFCSLQENCGFLETMKRPCSTAPTPSPPSSPSEEASGVGSHDTIDPAALAGRLQEYVRMSPKEQIDLHVDFSVAQILTLMHLRVVRICSIRAAQLIVARLLAFWTLAGVVCDSTLQTFDVPIPKGHLVLEIGVPYALKRRPTDTDDKIVYLWIGRHPSFYFNKHHSESVLEACGREIDRTYKNLDGVLAFVPALRTHDHH